MTPSFSATADPSLAKPRVAHLRKLMMAQNLEAYLVPHADEHQNEFLPPSAERLKWLTGFSGSAGLAVIGLKKAALFIDGRYTLQVQTECDPSLFEFLGPSDKKPTEWILSHCKKGATIGFDPWLHTINEITKMTSELAAKGLKLKAVSKNLVDTAWRKERPPPPLNPVVLHPIDKAGQKGEKKIAELQALLSQNNEHSVLLTALDSIAWLFNIRGSDIAHTPVALAFAYVPAKGKPELFIEPLKISKAEKKKLEEVVSIVPHKKMKERLNSLRRTQKTVRIDTNSAPFALKR
ncbi:MAG: aminopeptidase P family N-terminal domain-containing protein, partial [Hyphomicrobium sp.]